MRKGWAGAIAMTLVASSAWGEARVDLFTPTGEAKGVRQVAVRFSEPMVALGEPRLGDPFTWRCEGAPAAAKAKGRWADPTNWALDFPADLPAGVRCRFSLKPDLKTAGGQPLAGAKAFAFDTGGPAVLASLPREGNEAIDEDATFLLAFDAPVDAASFRESAWCEAKGVNERIPLQDLGPGEAKRILAQAPLLASRFYRVFFKGRPAFDVARFRIDDPRFRDLPLTAAKCTRRLPANAEVDLVIGAGVKTPSGLARGTPQRLAFKVRPDFTATFRCPRANKDAQCLPTAALRLDFSAPVARAVAEKIVLRSACGSARAAALDPDVPTVSGVRFEGPFPESAAFTIELPADLRDDAGRGLANASAFPLAVKTDRYPALLKFPARFGILEAADPVLPVTVRGVEDALAGRQAELSDPESGAIEGRAARIAGNEEQLTRRLLAFLIPPEYRPRRKTHAEAGEESSLESASEGEPLAIPRPLKGRATEVIGIPLRRPGFYIVELASPRLGEELHGDKGKPYYVATSALVTSLAVHLKLGRENSLVWVTQLADAKPVAGARTSIRDCEGALLAEGRTGSDGTWTVPKALPANTWQCPTIAFAQRDDDFSFTLSSWREGIEPWNFGFNSRPAPRAPVAIHTIFDRPLLRAGETVSMKHVARIPTGAGFRLPRAQELPAKLTLFHLGSGQRIDLAVRFDASGVAESRWTIPKEAKLGAYSVTWSLPGGVQLRAAGDSSFRVEAFRVPLMRAVLAPPKAPLVRPSSTKVDAVVTYLAGGPAGAIPVTVRSRVEPRTASFADYPEFRFGGEAVKEGVQTGSTADAYGFDDAEDDGESDGGGTPGAVSTRKLTLDAAGTAALPIDRLPPTEKPASLVVEMEYNDPNGERLSVSTRVPLHPAALYAGIKVDDWAASKTGVNAQVIVLDPLGKPVANRSVTVDLFERKTYSTRRRVLGGFYAYDTVTETRKAGDGCRGRTDAAGLVHCTVKPGISGELLLRAQVADDAHRTSTATASVWFSGGDDWWFGPSSNDRIDLVPEKRRYEPGETARFQVRMPFRSATVLVTVEREGILSHRIVQLDARSPVIEVPIVGAYGPNVYVSALAVRGRVTGREARPATALLDLAKPAYKLGEARIQVGRRDYELAVKVTTDRAVYKVREKARVDVDVRDASGRPAANGEVALAAVDEGLLELLDNTSWNLLDGMLGERPIEVVTATAQGQVVGKRHFGRKAVPAGGGGGGRSGTRELFDTLLSWQARVPLDANGHATVEVPLNDSMTSFRIVAVALQGASRFGTGRATIRATSDLMLFAGLPPVVREGDAFDGLFTLRNATAAPLPAKLAWTVRDAPGPHGRVIAKGEESVSLAANEGRVMAFPVVAPVDAARLHWEVDATSPAAHDALKVTQDVVPVHPVRAWQATLVQLDKPVTLPIERPREAIPGRGGVRVELMSSLAGDLSPVRDWFRRYPYACLEQRASKAIGLRDGAQFAAVGSALPNYLDGDGLARYFPTDALEGSDVLTAYLVQVADADGREWPEGALDRMLAGLEAFATGRITRNGALPTADLTLRKLAALEALSRHGRATPRMLEAIPLDPPRWPTSALIDWIGILQRVDGIPDRDRRREEAVSLLRARMNFQGTVMTFSSEKSDAFWWLMAGADSNANRALLAMLDEPALHADMGRLVRGAMSRQVGGTWSTTVANAWGTVALARYAKAFESVPVTGSTSITLGGEKKAIEAGPAKQSIDLPWPAGRATLAVAHEGTGAPWAILQSRAAMPLAEPFSTGYRITRTVKPIEQKVAGTWSRGDVYRVTLEIDAQSDMTWVVVDDPVPAGAAILGSGLGRYSALLASGEKASGWAWPAYVERTATAYHGYYVFVPKGKFSVDYTVRLNNAGRFDLPATRVEAMYAPDMLGETPNAPMVVKP